jgi:hypothetical protein
MWYHCVWCHCYPKCGIESSVFRIGKACPAEIWSQYDVDGETHSSFAVKKTRRLSVGGRGRFLGHISGNAQLLSIIHGAEIAQGFLDPLFVVPAYIFVNNFHEGPRWTRLTSPGRRTFCSSSCRTDLHMRRCQENSPSRSTNCRYAKSSLPLGAERITPRRACRYECMGIPIQDKPHLGEGPERWPA